MSLKRAAVVTSVAMVGMVAFLGDDEPSVSGDTNSAQETTATTLEDLTLAMVETEFEDPELTTATTEPMPPPQADPEPATEARLFADDFGEAWPFGENEVETGCNDDGSLWVKMSSGIYALNGAAIAAGLTELTLESPNAVWLDNPSTGLKVSLSEVTDAARALCA